MAIEGPKALLSKQMQARANTASKPNVSSPIFVGNQQDRVDISTDTSRFAELMAISGASSAVDVEKVAKVKQAIANGAYKVDVEKLAQNMINLDLSLFQEKDY